MIIVSISKRKLKLFAVAVLAVCLVSFGIYQIFGDQDAENYSELVDMLRNRDVAVSGEILEATNTSESNNEIQIFDISKGKVVKKMKTTPFPAGTGQKDHQQHHGSIYQGPAVPRQRIYRQDPRKPCTEGTKPVHQCHHRQDICHIYRKRAPHCPDPGQL
jgi:hypothetical protein